MQEYPEGHKRRPSARLTQRSTLSGENIHTGRDITSLQDISITATQPSFWNRL
jgi:hypothetical protein